MDLNTTLWMIDTLNSILFFAALGLIAIVPAGINHGRFIIRTSKIPTPNGVDVYLQEMGFAS
jgi:hypothetical protein